MAVGRALCRFGHLFKAQRVDLYIDNESARTTLQRGRSRSFMLNDKVLQTLPNLRDCLPSLYRVSSADNPSDEPSRGLPLDLEKVARWVNTFPSKHYGRLITGPNCVANSFGFPAIPFAPSYCANSIKHRNRIPTRFAPIFHSP